MVTWILPSDGHNPNDTGHTTDHNHIVDDLSLIGGSLTYLTGSNTLLVQVGSGYANGTFTAPGDGAQFSNFNLADGTFPLDQNPGGHYWAFSHRADSPVHRLLIFNYNGAGTYTNVVTILESGSFSTLHNTLDDGNGNLSVGATTNLGTGTATVAPIKFTSGTNLTTAAVGAGEFDGTVFYLTAQASSRQVVNTEQFTNLSGTFTLTNTTSAQKLFNATANGALTVQASTTYEFECEFDITSLSASSHTVQFLFGGTASFTSLKYVADSNTGAQGTLAAWQTLVSTVATATSLMAAGTTTTFQARIRGTLRVNAGGTIIPQIIQLTNSAAAVVGANSFFRIWPAGTNAVTNVGNWS